MNDFHHLSSRVFDSIERFDLNSLEALMSPDTKVWHNFDDTEKPLAQAMELLGLLMKAKRVKFEDIVIIPREHGWIQEHVVAIEDAKSNVHRIPAAMLFEVNDDQKICRIREYLDFTQLQKALTAVTSE